MCARRFRAQPLLAVSFVVGALLFGGLTMPSNGKPAVQWLAEGYFPIGALPSFVTTDRLADGSYRYIVNGKPQLFVGMGYNPIYRYLSDEERAARYDYDFQLLSEAGINHIIGWDADKGYDQDKWDELTLDYAHKYGLGAIMPFYLPPLGDYRDEAFIEGLMEEAAAKIERFKNHPALRIWGVGNEVLTDMPPGNRMKPAFARFYLRLVDMFRSLDPNHPVIFREAEDTFVPAINNVLGRSGDERPWLLYGMNIYTMALERILEEWPYEGNGRPLIVTEFGAEPDTPGGRAEGYLLMWQMIRAHPEYTLGGAPYAWTIDGPEPTDLKWGLTDSGSVPVDDTFERLAAEWRREKAERGN